MAARPARPAICLAVCCTTVLAFPKYCISVPKVCLGGPPDAYLPHGAAIESRCNDDSFRRARSPRISPNFATALAFFHRSGKRVGGRSVPGGFLGVRRWFLVIMRPTMLKAVVLVSLASSGAALIPAGGQRLTGPRQGFVRASPAALATERKKKKSPTDRAKEKGWWPGLLKRHVLSQTDRQPCLPPPARPGCVLCR